VGEQDGQSAGCPGGPEGFSTTPAAAAAPRGSVPPVAREEQPPAGASRGRGGGQGPAQVLGLPKRSAPEAPRAAPGGAHCWPQGREGGRARAPGRACRQPRALPPGRGQRHLRWRDGVVLPAFAGAVPTSALPNSAPGVRPGASQGHGAAHLGLPIGFPACLRSRGGTRGWVQCLPQLRWVRRLPCQPRHGNGAEAEGPVAAPAASSAGWAWAGVDKAQEVTQLPRQVSEQHAWQQQQQHQAQQAQRQRQNPMGEHAPPVFPHQEAAQGPQKASLGAEQPSQPPHHWPQLGATGPVCHPAIKPAAIPATCAPA